MRTGTIVPHLFFTHGKLTILNISTQIIHNIQYIIRIDEVVNSFAMHTSTVKLPAILALSAFLNFISNFEFSCNNLQSAFRILEPTRTSSAEKSFFFPAKNISFWCFAFLSSLIWLHAAIFSEIRTFPLKI